MSPAAKFNVPHTNSMTCITYSMTYISMKMEPNGRIPPRQTMTAGSMNLRRHNIENKKKTQRFIYIETISKAKNQMNSIGMVSL